MIIIDAKLNHKSGTQVMIEESGGEKKTFFCNFYLFIQFNQHKSNVYVADLANFFFFTSCESHFDSHSLSLHILTEMTTTKIGYDAMTEFDFCFSFECEKRKSKNCEQFSGRR